MASIMRWVQTGAVAATVALLPTLMPTAAAAAPPPRGETTTLTFPSGELCDFPVTIVVNDATKLHPGPGAVFSTGTLTATITNDATGETQTFNVSGPTFKNGTLTGPALVLQPASAGLGPAFLIVNKGRVTFTENNTIATITGNTTDVCAVLA